MRINRGIVDGKIMYLVALIILLCILGFLSLTKPQNKSTFEDNQASQPSNTIPVPSKEVVNPTPNESSSGLATIHGTIMFGKGDCMPPHDENSRNYTNYTGTLYFVKKTAVDELSKVNRVPDIRNLFHSSISTTVTDGKYAATEIPAETYYLAIPGGYYAQGEEIVTVRTVDTNITKNVTFFLCTSI